MTVIKRNKPYPFVATSNSLTGIIVYSTMSNYAGGVFIGNPTASSVPDGGILQLPSSAVRVPLPRAPSGTRLTAISLAPDSMHSACDIWLAIDGGGEAWRVDIQNPAVGIDIGDQPDIWVTVPNAVPVVVPSATVMVWDGTLVRDTADPNGLWTFPLRLLFWFDGAPSTAPVKRPPLHARFRMQAGNGLTVAAYAAVEGRSTVIVRAVFGAGTYDVNGWYSRNTAGATQIDPSVQRTAFVTAVNETPSGDTVAETSLPAPQIIGMQLVKVTHHAAAGGDVASMTMEIHAYD